MRIQRSAVIQTEAEVMAERERAQKLKDEREKKSKERKERMKELEKKAVLLAKKSDIEIQNEARAEAIRLAAAEKLNMNSDTVKLLTSIASKAIAYSLRDEQLHEKEEREKVEREYDRRMDIIMEIDRLKDIQRRETDEEDKRKKRYEDRKVINIQIAERQRQRILEAEAKEQEGRAQIALAQKYIEEDKISAEKHKVEIERSRLEVVKANDDAIRRKKEGKAALIKEMEDILIYQAMKDAELAKREEEEAAIEHAKKERQAKLLAQQEKAQGQADKLDELRARRAAEEKERIDRKKQKDEAEKRKADMKLLLEHRAKQAEDKKLRAGLSKIQEEEEMRNALEYMQKMQMREEAERLKKVQLANEHRENIHNQIRDNESRRKAGFTNKFDEGDKIRQKNLAEIEKLSVIRDRMIQDLEAKGINPRYLTEMKNVNISKIVNR